MKIIENKDGVANGKIYNIGNPRNNYSVRELAEMMLARAKSLPEYRDSASRVRLVEVASEAYYGGGYQDVLQRVPDIGRTQADLDWQPVVGMDAALAALFAYYRDQTEAAELVP